MKVFTSRAVSVGVPCMTKKTELSLENARWSDNVNEGVVFCNWNWVLTRVLIGNTKLFPLKIC